MHGTTSNRDNVCAAYKRVLLKLSGEALAGKGTILSHEMLTETSLQIKRCHSLGVQFAIVIGAGNIWRGSRQGGLTIDRVRGDHMGMLSTVINSLAMQDYLMKTGVDTVVMSAIRIDQICEQYSQYKAAEHLDAGRCVIIACGVGYPYFSTDTGMILRAAELNADIVLSAKHVDGVYDKDPNLYPDAIKFEKLTYDELIARDLKVIDGAAGALARENHIKQLLFSLDPPENIYRAVIGERTGTLIE